MPIKSYGFAIGNLRYRENYLLNDGDLSQLSSSANVEELAASLSDKGIGEQNEHSSIPQMLHDETKKLWKYIDDTAPDMASFEPFIYENDFHNYKTILKGVIRGRSYSELLITPAIVDIKDMEKAIKEKKFDILPEYMFQSATDSFDVLAKSGDSQLSDCIIDAGCMTAQLNKAKEINNEIILNIIKTTVFYSNIKAALRCSNSNKSKIFMENCLTETGIVSKRAMINAALSGTDKLLDLLATAVSVGGPEASECFKISAGEFEKYVDNRIMSTVKKCKYVTMGIEPIIGYMLARKSEIKNLRIIYSGVKTGQPEEKIKERLRDIYD